MGIKLAIIETKIIFRHVHYLTVYRAIQIENIIIRTILSAKKEDSEWSLISVKYIFRWFKEKVIQSLL